MILRDQILAQLQEKRDGFRHFEASFQSEADDYRKALEQLAKLSEAELLACLQDEPTPGALPTAEFDSARHLCLPFAHEWSNHAEARVWACDTLLNHTSVTVDGSQIPPSKDYNIPVAAVQVAWFENHHTREGSYDKNLVFEILTPQDLIVEMDGERQVSEQVINQRRFQLETQTLCGLMERLASKRTPSSLLPVALFDSSLVISFADRLQPIMREAHVQAMLELLRCSEQTRIPVIGYIDSSQARDLTNMLAYALQLKEVVALHDAALIDDVLRWGERTPFFICARGSADHKKQGILESFEEYKRALGFVYLKTSATAPPARLEIPKWVYDAGLLDEVLDLVRAEIIVGNGYPYAISAVDAAAAINHRDREAFYAIFQRFAEEQGIELRISQKATSKERRR